jgi:hypothetical protein
MFELTFARAIAWSITSAMAPVSASLLDRCWVLSRLPKTVYGASARKRPPTNAERDVRDHEGLVRRFRRFWD